MNTLALKPFPQFFNGGITAITKINVVSIDDNLVDAVTFKYTLLTEDELVIAEGEVALNADTYAEWDASMYGAHNVVAKHLGLELAE